MAARTSTRSNRKKAQTGGEAKQSILDRMDAGDQSRLRSTLSVQRTAPTLRVLALEKLRSAIIDGEFAPNTRLVERQLCDLLGVSRTIVREILRQLEAEGWVVNPPYKGPTVTAISFDQAMQMYEMRGSLEGLAARLCARRATAEQIKELEGVVDEMAMAQSKHDLPWHLDTIRRFYEVMLTAAGNEILAEFLSSQYHRLMRLRSMSLFQPKRAAVSVIEKRRILTAIKQRDEKAAQLASELHVRKAAEAAQIAYRSNEAMASDNEQPKAARRRRKNIAAA